jgi:hypothetical protein
MHFCLLSGLDLVRPVHRARATRRRAARARGRTPWRRASPTSPTAKFGGRRITWYERATPALGCVSPPAATSLAATAASPPASATPTAASRATSATAHCRTQKNRYEKITLCSFQFLDSTEFVSIFARDFCIENIFVGREFVVVAAPPEQAAKHAD